jgi:hypothetical protein
MGIRNDIESWFPNIIGEDLKIFSVSSTPFEEVTSRVHYGRNVVMCNIEDFNI